MELVAGVLLGLIAGYLIARWVARRNAASSERRAHEIADKAEGEARRRAEEIVSRAERESAELFARAERDAVDIRSRADRNAEDTVARATTEAEEIKKSAVRESEALKGELERREKAVKGMEDSLDTRSATLDRRDGRLEEAEKTLADREAAVGSLRSSLDDALAEAAKLKEEGIRRLEKVAGMTAAQAREQLVASIEEEAKRDALALVRTMETKAREEADRRARRIVVTAVQRLAAEQAQEASVTVLQIPSEEMKGRIIGREGRNIRHFEQVTGVNLVIDDTPEAVLLSCFDPVRREMGRLTLESLVADGRINPSRIEEQFERAAAEVREEIRRAGEETVDELGITNMHPELVRALGRLKYRYSYGQNVLRHSVEAANIAGMIAAELGTDVALAKRCTLLHDLGKAVAQEVEGSHAYVGAELARRLGESPQVCHAIEAHHNEIEMRTVEAVITQAADAISGSRPGARRESFEAYVKRLERLEELAGAFPGVQKVYAMQAGREVRVMVDPGDVDDVAASVLSREIAKKIEEELQYPGQIRVLVLRETRSVEYAR